MSKIKDLLFEEMPREKLINLGPENLSDVELLAIILRTGTKKQNVIELSREILKTFQIDIISRKTYYELIKFGGIKKAKATQLVALFELVRRFSTKKSIKKIKITSSKDVYNHIKIDFDNLKLEKVMVLLVNSKNFIIKKEFISEGSLNYSIIEINTILKKIFLFDASGFFLIHNHPSGDTTPSKEDIEVTKKIFEITNKLNIRFLDHLIVGENYFSCYDNNIF